MWCIFLLHPRTHLGADEQVGDTGRVLLQLRHPFFAHVLETGWVHHREADEEDVGHRVGQRPEAVVVLLEDDATELVNMCSQRKMRSKAGSFNTREIILINYLKLFTNELQ